MVDENQTNDTGEKKVAAAPEQVETSEPAVEKKEEYVPLSALQQERAQRQQMQEDLRLMKENIALLYASKKSQERSNEPSQDDSEDLMTVGQFRKNAQELEKKYKASLEELRIMQRFPDYKEVIENHLPEIVKENPKLGQYFQSTQDYQLAYDLAKKSSGYQTKHAAKNDISERILKNADAPVSAAAVGKVSAISEAKRWKDMSQEDFIKIANKNAGFGM